MTDQQKIPTACLRCEKIDSISLVIQLRKELMLAPMKNRYCFSRDEVIALLGGVYIPPSGGSEENEQN